MYSNLPFCDGDDECNGIENCVRAEAAFGVGADSPHASQERELALLINVQATHAQSAAGTREGISSDIVQSCV